MDPFKKLLANKNYFDISSFFFLVALGRIGFFEWRKLSYESINEVVIAQTIAVEFNESELYAFNESESATVCYNKI